MGKFKLNPEDPQRLTDTQQARLHQMSDAEIPAGAAGDRDNPLLTDAELETLDSAAFVRAVRRANGFSQSEFAEAFGFSVGRLRDLEQGRTQIDSAIRSYLTVIQKNSMFVLLALGKGPDGRPVKVSDHPALLTEAARYGLERSVVPKAVFLTHHDGDHGEEVAALVRYIGNELRENFGLLRNELVHVVEEAAIKAAPKKRSTARHRH